MQLVFAIRKNGRIINTYNGMEIDPYDKVQVNRFEKKNQVLLFPHVVKNSCFYKYRVYADKDKVALLVYRGLHTDSENLRDSVIWMNVYIAITIKGEKGIKESGEKNLEYWHDYFAKNLGYDLYDEKNVASFSSDEDSMEIVRTVFPSQMQTNVFAFFKKQKNLRMLKPAKFDKGKLDKKIFDIPAVKINRKVGKKFDGQYINYALQREVELAGEVFFDILVISGMVANGVMNVEKKHRYFISEDFIYSPDNGPLGVFVSGNLYGKIHDQKMRKRYPNLMLDKYQGKYYFQYFFAKEFIPCFEILAKAGLYRLADIMLDDYYNDEQKIVFANLYGKNDKEIFEFKLSRLRNIEACFDEENKLGERRNFDDIILTVRTICKTAPAVMDVKNIDANLYYFMEKRKYAGVTVKDMEYLKSIGTENARLYVDYLRMCERVGRYSNGKYPKDVKYAHDVMVTYLNQIKKAENNKKFEQVVTDDKYLNKCYEGEEYCILAPRTADDLVKESYRLGHCVRVYIDDVSCKRCQIYFLRKKNQKAKSLVTIEVANREVCQAHGKYNRKLTEEELDFVKEWAENKNISLDVRKLRYYGRI